MIEHKIILKDHVELFDFSSIQGFVRIYINDILNIDQSPNGWLTNMTIGSGRDFVCQRLFGFPNSSSSNGDCSKYVVDSFGIGSGGSTVNVLQEVELNSPRLCNYGMYSPLPLGTALPYYNVTNNNGNDVNYVAKKIKTNYNNGYDGDIVITEKTDHQFSCSQTGNNAPIVKTFYTVGKLTCIIEPGLFGNTITKVDEAMLFATNLSIVQQSDPVIMIPFAHICFSPKFLEPNASLKIEWYVIC